MIVSTLLVKFCWSAFPQFPLAPIALLPKKNYCARSRSSERIPNMEVKVSCSRPVAPSHARAKTYLPGLLLPPLSMESVSQLSTILRPKLEIVFAVCASSAERNRQDGGLVANSRSRQPFGGILSKIRSWRARSPLPYDGCRSGGCCGKSK